MNDNLDSSILKKFQSFSDWCQEWIGIDNFWLAKFFVVLDAFNTLFAGWIKLLVGFGAPQSGIATAVSLIFSLLYWKLISRNQAISRDNPEVLSILVARLYLIRLLCLFSLPIIFLHLLNMNTLLSADDCEKCFKVGLHEMSTSLGFIFIIMIIFFASCTPKPKKPSKVKEWSEKMSEKIEAVFNPAPSFA